MPKNSTPIINIGPGLSLLVGHPTIETWDTASRPQRARRGTFGFNFQTQSLEYCDGTEWYTALMNPE